MFWFFALMAALLFLYTLHPLAGWTTLTLFVVLIAGHRRKAPAEAGR
jgi:hypothetical protein